MTVIARRPRPLLAVLAATCLLTAACTGSDPTGPEDGSSAPSASDGGPTTSAEPTPGAGSVVVMVLNDGVSDVLDVDADPALLPAQDLEALIAVQDGVDEAEAPGCEGDLAFAEGESVACTATITVEGLAGAQQLTAVPVRFPSGFEPAGAPGVIVAVGAPLAPAAAAALSDPDHHVVGVGQGSMFGTEEIGAEELAKLTESTINHPAGYAPVDAPMVVESCEGPLPVGAREPVTCTAAFAHDPATTVDAQVLSVSSLGEGGLLVALDLGGADAEG